MSSHPCRFPGWSDLKSNAIHLLSIAVFAAASAAAFQKQSVSTAPADVQLEPRAESPDDRVFLAPFVNASFLKAVETELQELQVLLERSTGIYFDKKTELVWAAGDNGRDIDWRRASDYCYELELAGFDDWRMPTLGELEDLMNPMSNSLYSTPEQISLTACCVWSSTRRDDLAAWNFNFRYSKRFSGSLTHTFDLRALCLRKWGEADGWHPDDELETSLP